MKKNLLFFILLALAVACFVFLTYSHIMKVDPKRVSINEKGEEVIMLNELEKQLVGKWYVAYDSSATTTPVSVQKRKGTFYEFKENGMVSHYYYDKPKGTEYWGINPKDSLLKYTNSLPLTRFSQILSIEETEFKARELPNAQIGNTERWLTWKRYE